MTSGGLLERITGYAFQSSNTTLYNRLMVVTHLLYKSLSLHLQIRQKNANLNQMLLFDVERFKKQF